MDKDGWDTHRDLYEGIHTVYKLPFPEVDQAINEVWISFVCEKMQNRNKHKKEEGRRRREEWRYSTYPRKLNQ